MQAGSRSWSSGGAGMKEGAAVSFSPPPRLCWQDYELQLMTYRAFVESQQKSPMKRRRMLSSSDAITQEVGTCLSPTWGSEGGWGALPLHPTARRPL